MDPAHGVSSIDPIELSLPLPKAAHTNLHLHLTFLATSTMVLLTTTTIGESGTTTAPLGSFVYALPDLVNPPNVISTALYTSPSSIDYATRTAKILARKMVQPVYVGCSMNFSGITTEEEMEGLRKVVEIVLSKREEHRAAQ